MNSKEGGEKPKTHKNNKHCKSNVAVNTSLKSANQSLPSARIRWSFERWGLELSIDMTFAVTMGVNRPHAWRMKQSHSCLRWNKNVQSRFAVLHFGDGRLHEVFEGPQGVFEGGAYFRRRAGDALHQRRVQRDHLSPHVPVHWQEDRNEQKQGSEASNFCLGRQENISPFQQYIFTFLFNAFT